MMSRITNPTIRILQVSTFEKAGGAERVAWNLFQAYRQRGYPSWLIVGRKQTADPDVFELDHHKHSNLLTRYLVKIARRFEKKQEDVRGAYRLREITEIVAEPRRWIRKQQGHEDFDFPGTYDLLNLTPQSPQIVHCHNLHGKYFDLRALPWLSHQVPVILTLHDAWMLSGHCAHSFECERWQIGCGQCPDLTIPPAICRDATDLNWQRKRDIYSQSRLFISTPSRWLMNKVEQSILGGEERRIIPNGVDLETFKPGDKLLARKTLGLPLDASILLFASYKIKNNRWRDYVTLEKAVQVIANQEHKRRIVFVCLGDRQDPKQFMGAEVRFIPFESNMARLVQYYQAADVYLYAAKADTFPNTIIEALACGTPVVATAVGGIPEQIEDGESGFLAPSGDSHAIAQHVLHLMNYPDLRRQMGQVATTYAQHNFGLDRQVKTYLEWFRELRAIYKTTTSVVEH